MFFRFFITFFIAVSLTRSSAYSSSCLNAIEATSSVSYSDLPADVWVEILKEIPFDNRKLASTSALSKNIRAAFEYVMRERMLHWGLDRTSISSLESIIRRKGAYRVFSQIEANWLRGKPKIRQYKLNASADKTYLLKLARDFSLKSATIAVTLERFGDNAILRSTNLSSGTERVLASFQGSNLSAVNTKSYLIDQELYIFSIGRNLLFIDVSGPGSRFYTIPVPDGDYLIKVQVDKKNNRIVGINSRNQVLVFTFDEIKGDVSSTFSLNHRHVDRILYPEHEDDHFYTVSYEKMKVWDKSSLQMLASVDLNKTTPQHKTYLYDGKYSKSSLFLSTLGDLSRIDHKSSENLSSVKIPQSCQNGSKKFYFMGQAQSLILLCQSKKILIYETATLELKGQHSFAADEASVLALGDSSEVLLFEKNANYFHIIDTARPQNPPRKISPSECIMGIGKRCRPGDDRPKFDHGIDEIIVNPWDNSKIIISSGSKVFYYDRSKDSLKEIYKAQGDQAVIKSVSLFPQDPNRILVVKEDGQLVVLDFWPE